MGTRSKTTIFNEEHKPILSFYRQFDGYFEGHGQDLADYLRNRKITNGYGLNDSEATRVSNGMNCLAASIIAHFKTGIGGVYIVDHDDDQEYNYEIQYNGNPYDGKGRVILVGKGHKETKKFKLYDGEVEELSDFPYNELVEFHYEKADGSESHRKIGVLEESDDYIMGLDLEDGNKYKVFKKENITNGIKVIWTKPKTSVNYHNKRDSKGRFVKG